MDEATQKLLREAREQESFHRACAFGVEREFICGMTVLPLAIWHVMVLDAIQSPFVGRSERCRVEDIVNFLWIVSPHYRPNAMDRKWFWLTRCRKLKASEAVKAIVAYVSEAFADGPSASNDGASYYSAAAALVDLIASQYGWSEQEILRTPLKRCFQYRKAIRYRLQPQEPQGNRSDGIIQSWLDRANS